MMLTLNAFLLRANVTPATVWASDPPGVEMHYWENGHIEPLSLEEAEVFDVAIAGAVVVAIQRRLNAPSPWQAFIKDALSLDSFGSAHESLGAVIFCAVS